MRKLMKKLNPAAAIIAIGFLIVQAACDLYIPTITANLVDMGIARGDMAYIWSQGGKMIALTVLSFAAAVLNALVASRLVNRFAAKLRGEIYAKAMHFSAQEFNRIGVSSLMTRNTNDVKQVQMLVDDALKVLILAPAYMVFGFVFAFRLSAPLAMLFVYALPILLLFALGIFLYATPQFMMAQRKTDAMNRIFREGVNGAKVIRAFGRDDYEYRRYQEESGKLRQISIRANTVTGLLAPLLTLVMSLATILIVFLGAGRVEAGTLEVGALMGVVSYATQILMGFTTLAMAVANIPRGMVSAKRIGEVLDMPLSITDGAEAADVPQGEASLSFSAAGYRYPGAEKAALAGISFRVNAGQTLAVVGGTGAGKSTLLRLILRLYDADQGAVCLHGADVRRVSLHDLRGRIGYVPQKPVLFFGTVRSNLHMAAPDASDAEIWAALEASEAAGFVREKGGLDAPVDKNGGNFSGGQRQRLCIARAILKQADIYIFDDSFSALDFKTDAKIRTNLERFLKGSIKVIAAQRISTVMGADVILCLHAGRMAGMGTHEELLRHNAVYQEIAASQSEREEIA